MQTNDSTEVLPDSSVARFRGVITSFRRLFLSELLLLLSVLTFGLLCGKIEVSSLPISILVPGNDFFCALRQSDDLAAPQISGGAWQLGSFLLGALLTVHFSIAIAYVFVCIRSIRQMSPLKSEPRIRAVGHVLRLAIAGLFFVAPLFLWNFWYLLPCGWTYSDKALVDAVGGGSTWVLWREALLMPLSNLAFWFTVLFIIFPTVASAMQSGLSKG